MENKNAALLGAIVIALVAGAAGWALRDRTAAAAEPLATREDNPPAQPAENASGPVDVARTAVPALPPSAPSAQDVVATHAANEAAAVKIAEAGEQKLRSRYEAERVDQAWASRKQQALEQLSTSPLIEQVNAQPLAINTQCRSSVCLIEVDLPSRLAAEDWYTLYTMNAGLEMFASSSRSIVNPDGSVHLQIYGLAKQ